MDNKVNCLWMIVSFNSNTAGATNGAGIANSSGTPQFIPSLNFLFFV